MAFRVDSLLNQKESFTYDADNCLRKFEVKKSATSDVHANLVSWAIDVAGNVDSLTSIHGSIKHEAPAVNAISSIYGNPSPILQIPATDKYISYTDFGKVATIDEDYYTYDISYSPSRQRYKSVFTNSSDTVITRYYFGDYEEEEIRVNNKVVLSRSLTYLTGDNGMFGIVERKNGTDSLFYTYTDYQGNLLAVADNTGKVVERYAYDPWGNRRNPSNWAQRDNRANLKFYRGYTMHEHLPWFKLINMNGRMYDPELCSFISPDPQLQAPDYWLNHNRYAYCYNNPLKYTDPSGEWCIYDDLIAMVVGGVFNWATNGCRFDSEGLQYFAVGAASAELTLYGGPCLGSVVNSCGNNAVYQLNHESEFDYGSMLWAGFIGLVTSSIGGSINTAISPYIGNGVSYITTNVIVEETITNSLSYGISGFITGTLNSKVIYGNDWEQALEDGGEGALWGAGLGATNGFISGYKSYKTEKALMNKSVYDFKPDPLGDNVTLYRGTTGNENPNSCLFMTDDPMYAESYILNGGRVVSVTIPRSTLIQMQLDGVVSYPTPGINSINNYSGYEYIISPNYSGEFINLFR